MADLSAFIHHLSNFLNGHDHTSEVHVLHSDSGEQIVTFRLGDDDECLIHLMRAPITDGAASTGDLARMRQEGALESLMSDVPSYVLMAYQSHPNGTTAPLYEQDPATARAIGAKTGLGDPTDPLGWAIWDIGPVTTSLQ